MSEKYLYDGLNIVADLTAANSVTSVYNTELQLDQMLSFKKGSTKQYYHTDHLGSIRKLTNASGRVTESSSYEAFGKEKSGGTATRYGFTGREDESDFGLMYYRARYYDPDAGRFISPDPFTRGPDDPRVSYSNNWYSKIHGEATLYTEWLNPHNFNRYLYCSNNPVINVDPLGQNPAIIAGLITYTTALLAAPDLQMDMQQIALDAAMGDNVGVALDVVGAAVPALTATEVKAGVKAAEKVIDTSKMVLGKWPKYLEKAKELGCKAFNIPSKYWDKLSDAEKVAANQKSIDRVVNRGGELLLSDTPKNATGAFADELKYVEKKHGLVPNSKGKKLIKKKE